VADAINLPNLVSHLQVNLEDTNGLVAEAGRQGSSVGAALGRSLQQRVGAAVRDIPAVELDADSTRLDRDLDRVRRELRSLARTRIGVDISVEDAIRQVDSLQPHLDRLEREHPDVNVTASIARARAQLDEILTAAHHVDATSPDIDVDVDTARPLAALAALRRAGSGIGSALSTIGPGLGMLAQIGGFAGAAIPIVAGLVATIQNLLPALAVSATAALSVGSAFAALKLGTSGIGDAISAAFAPATGGGKAAAASTNAVTDAQRNLKDAIQQAAQANAAAIRRVTDAQRDLTDAQKAAKQAQLDLVAAEKDATRQLEDQNNQLADAKLDERQAVKDVEDAEKNLAAVRAKGAAASADEQEEAQLQYDRAVQGLKEQQLTVQRLQVDTDAANKAGVQGSQEVQQAQEQVASTARDVGDRQRDVADAQEDVARTAAQGAEAIDRAREALQQAGQTAGGSAGQVDAFAEAMSHLSPEAQAFVREIIKLKPAFDSLKLDVQEHLFQGLAGVLDETAHALLPDVRKSLDDSADSLNGMAKGVGAAAQELAEDGTLGKALAGANKGLSNLVPIPGFVVTALGQVGAAAAPAFDRLTKLAADAAQRVSERLAGAAKSGALEDSINFAIDLFGELFGVIGNIVKIVENIFAPAVSSGDNFLGVVQDITGELDKATKAKGFQDAMSALFGVIGEIGKVAGPLLLLALADLEPVLTHLGPPALRLVDALGKALQPVIEALAPLLVAAADGVGALADQADPLIELVGTLAAALGPALQPILDNTATLIADLPIKELADDLNLTLSPILAALPGLIKPLSDLIAQQLAYGLGVVADLLRDNGPAFAELGVEVANLLVALIPLITQLGILNADILTECTPLIIAVADAATRLATVLVDDLGTVINGLIIPTITILADLLKGKWGAAWDEATAHVGSAIKAVLILIGGLPYTAAQALAPLAEKLGKKASDAGNAMVNAINRGVGDAVDWLKDFPRKAANALSNYGDTFYNSGRAILTDFIRGMVSKLQDAKDAAGNILGKIKDYFPNSPAKTGPFSGKGWTHHSGVAVMDDWGGGMVAAIPGLLSNVRSAVGAAAGALSGTPAFAGAFPSSGALAGTYAGTAAPATGTTNINLYGTEATPEGVSSALSWRSKVGRR
jgi:hypothetical protein